MASQTVTELNPNRRMRGLDRALEILDFLRDLRRPARPHEIALGIGAPKSTAYELINLLLKNGILEYADKDGRVFLGRRLYFLGLAYQSNFDLTRECKDYLTHLAGVTRETSQLCMLDGDKYVVAMMCEGERPFNISSEVGKPLPLPWTASGRLLVAHMSDAEIRDFIPEADYVLPDGSRLDPDVFIGEVQNARAEGFFSFDTLVDNFTHCFAAPVFQEDRICAATLCLIAPRGDAERNYDHYRDTLLKSAHEFSARLGTTPLRFSQGRVG